MNPLKNLRTRLVSTHFNKPVENHRFNKFEQQRYKLFHINAQIA